MSTTTAKAYANVLRAHLTEHFKGQLLDQQSGFRPDRSCTDALFKLRLLCESAWNKHRTLYLCMLDLTKAFDSVDRSMTWQILSSRGVPAKQTGQRKGCFPAVAKGQSMVLQSLVFTHQATVFAVDCHVCTAVWWGNLDVVDKALGCSVSISVELSQTHLRHFDEGPCCQCRHSFTMSSALC